MTEERFWEIVETIGWPETHYDVAKRRFMETYPKETAAAFRGLFHPRSATRATTTWLTSSAWESPHLIWEREERIDYKESFAYCIPFEEDYALLTDEGYAGFIRSATASPRTTR